MSEAAAAYDYDVVVIGGGSGGLACSKAAAGHGANVAVLDFVQPSPQGSTWGLGGTCVNVGCIPKKLMHQAALLGHAVEDARTFGWDLPEAAATHTWTKLVEGVQDHIGSLNWGYRVQLRDKNVKYLNAYGSFEDAHTLKMVNKRGKETTVTSAKFVLAMGGRPSFPDVPGIKEHCLTSDDLFVRKTPPGKTLVVGASYVSLECAGFLRGLGYDTTVMVRSILLRGFDRDMAERIGDFMEKHDGVKFIRPAVPTKVEKQEDGKLLVTFTVDGQQQSDTFDTVMVATGRTPCTSGIGLEKLGVTLDERSKKVIVNEFDQTSAEHVYAIGDIALGRPELTPSAIQAGIMLSARLFAGATAPCDYVNVSTTVFTPLEYGCCGLSEEEAIEKLGSDNVEVFHAGFQPLEYTVAHRPEDVCYSKLICKKDENMRVVGLHILSPNAGEITQGFGLAIKMGATKEQFDTLIGIHPTNAEIFTTMTVTKSSGEELVASGC